MKVSIIAPFMALIISYSAYAGVLNDESRKIYCKAAEGFGVNPYYIDRNKLLDEMQFAARVPHEYYDIDRDGSVTREEIKETLLKRQPEEFIDESKLPSKPGDRFLEIKARKAYIKNIIRIRTEIATALRTPSQKLFQLRPQRSGVSIHDYFYNDEFDLKCAGYQPKPTPNSSDMANLDENNEPEPKLFFRGAEIRKNPENFGKKRADAEGATIAFNEDLVKDEKKLEANVAVGLRIPNIFADSDDKVFDHSESNYVFLEYNANKQFRDTNSGSAEELAEDSQSETIAIGWLHTRKGIIDPNPLSSDPNSKSTAQDFTGLLTNSPVGYRATFKPEVVFDLDDGSQLFNADLELTPAFDLGLFALGQKNSLISPFDDGLLYSDDGVYLDIRPTFTGRLTGTAVLNGGSNEEFETANAFFGVGFRAGLDMSFGVQGTPFDKFTAGVAYKRDRLIGSGLQSSDRDLLTLTFGHTLFGRDDFGLLLTYENGVNFDNFSEIEQTKLSFEFKY